MQKQNNTKTVQGFFDLKECADFMKCSTATVRNYIKSGSLKAFQPGGSNSTILVAQGNLIDFITSKPVSVREKKNAPRP